MILVWILVVELLKAPYRWILLKIEQSSFRDCTRDVKDAKLCAAIIFHGTATFGWS